MAQDNKNEVLILKSPEDKKVRKSFLGYEWSSAKGNEGIKYLGGSERKENEDDVLEVLKGIYSIQTPLFNPNNLNDEGKINTYIRKHFIGEHFTISKENKAFVSLLPLVNMLDFSRASFDKAFRTSVQKNIEVKSKYPLMRLGSIADVLSGNSAPQERHLFTNGIYPFFRTSDVGKVHLSKNLTEVSDYLNEKGIERLRKFPKGTILMPKSGASTYLNHRVIMGVDGYVVSHLATIIADNKQILTEFLFELLVLVKAQDIKVNSDYPSLNKSDIDNIKIPLPPLDIQKKIVAECEKIDEEYENSRMSIEAYRGKIAQIFHDLQILEKTERGG